jgi:hypothetical protein
MLVMLRRAWLHIHLNKIETMVLIWRVFFILNMKAYYFGLLLWLITFWQKSGRET